MSNRAKRRATARPRVLPLNEQWTATRAAVLATDLRDDYLQRAPGNPLLHDTRTLEIVETIAASRDAVELWAAQQRLQLTADGLDVLSRQALGMSSDDGEPADVARQELAWHDKMMKLAELYVISPAMHATVMAAVATLTEEDRVGWHAEDDLLCDYGMLVLPGVQLVRTDPDAPADDVIAISWGRFSVDGVSKVRATMYLDGEGPVHSPAYTIAKRAAAASGHPLPRLAPRVHAVFCIDPAHRDAVAKREAADARRWRKRARLITAADLQTVSAGATAITESQLHSRADGVYVADSEPLVVGDFSSWAHRYLMAFMRLAAQRIATVARLAEHTHAPQPAKYEPVRVVQLRGFSPTDATATEDGTRAYHHRWVVRMHKVRQWYPTEGVHKVIWRGPYVKGPENAPLLAGELVNALVR